MQHTDADKVFKDSIAKLQARGTYTKSKR